MRRIGLIALAAFVGGASAIGAYRLLDHNDDNLSLAEKQNVIFANNPVYRQPQQFPRQWFTLKPHLGGRKVLVVVRQWT
jgi:hypothetical protein